MDERLKKIIDASKNIVFFGGAGVSTESGIPDFRSESGLYAAKEEFGYSPETILSHSFFLRNPKVFFRYYKKFLVYKDAQPNKAHLALAKLEKDGKVKAVITQNIDDLHQAAGSKVVYQLHGTTSLNTCMHCGKQYNLDYVMNEANCKESVPYCSCGGVIKPDVVLYEEALDEEVINASVKAISQADTLIVGGTSLVVYPAAGFVRYFKGDKLVLINKTKTHLDDEASLVIHENIGKVMGI